MFQLCMKHSPATVMGCQSALASAHPSPSRSTSASRAAMLASARAALAASAAWLPLQWVSADALLSAGTRKGSCPASRAAVPSANTRFSFASTSFCYIARPQHVSAAHLPCISYVTIQISVTQQEAMLRPWHACCCEDGIRLPPRHKSNTGPSNRD